jgi:hypothetical protein
MADPQTTAEEVGLRFKEWWDEMRKVHSVEEINAMLKVPSAERCIPPNPETHGYHWVRRYRTGPIIPLCWHPEWHRNAGRGWGKWSAPDREGAWEYIAPCPFPEGVVHGHD